MLIIKFLKYPKELDRPTDLPVTSEKYSLTISNVVKLGLMGKLVLS
jgi:hypothetical protein